MLEGPKCPGAHPEEHPIQTHEILTLNGPETTPGVAPAYQPDARFAAPQSNFFPTNTFQFPPCSGV